MKPMTRLRSFALVFLVLACTAAFGQTSQGYLNDLGNTPYGVNIPVENGFINISNGNLHLEFPIANPPQRGALSVNERIVYDSRIWMFSPFGTHGSYHWWPYNVNAAGGTNSSGGWRFVKGNEIGTISSISVSFYSYTCNPDDNAQSTNEVDQIIWTDSSGTAHPLNASINYSYDACQGTSSQNVSPGTATDGSGYSATDDGNGNPVVSDNSGTQVYPQVIDRYGNYLSGSGDLVDDTGRVPVLTTQNGNVTYYDVLVQNGPINNNGLRARYTVTTAPVPVATNFGQSDVYEWNPANPILNPVKSIQLPNGSQYSFTYDGYGGLASMTLPTGGTVYYGYSNFVDSSNTANRWLSSHTVGSNPAMTFTPSVVTGCANYGSGCVEQVNLHKPSGDETVYQLTLNNGAWNTGVTAYTGAASGGQRLSSVSTVDTYLNGCSIGYCTGQTYVSQSLSTTTLYGLQTVTAQTQTFYNPSVGQVSAVKSWDYGANFGGTPTRETDYTYTGLDVGQVTVLSNGNTAGQTTYGYTTTPAQTTSGVAQHGPQNAGGPYLQTVSHFLAGGSASVTTYGMDDTGQVVSTSDPNGNPLTTFTYQYNNSLPYRTTNPLGQTTQYAYDWNAGVITGVQDPNDLANNRSGTTYAYEGLAGRLQSVNYPDGGQTSYSYPSPTEVDTTVRAAPSPSLSSQDFLDSFGRKYQHVQAGVSSETFYDANGRVLCTTNPRTSSGAGTDGSTCITAYDGLDRPLTQQQPDGATLLWTYNAATTTSTDETGKQWQRTSDSFGHLTQVVEPGSYATTYTYDGLGNLRTITQNGAAGSDTPRVRTFLYDTLSRLTNECHPEAIPAGQTCTLSGPWSTSYIYYPNGNTRTQTDARGLTVSYQYDALNRLTSKNASDNSFNYDYSYDDSSKSNGIGRLTHSSNHVNGASNFYYDPVGRIVARYVCAPNDCSYLHGGSGTYDLAGNLINSHITTGADVGASFDGAGRLAGSSYNLTGVTSSPMSLMSNMVYGPTGISQAQLGNGIREDTTYDNRTRVSTFAAGPATSSSSGGTPPFGVIDFAGNSGQTNASIPQGELLYARGWAADAEDGSPAQVVLTIDGHPAGQATLGLSRPDVANAYSQPAYSNSGWSITASLGNLSPGQHTVRATMYDWSGNVATIGNSQTITVTSDSPPVVNVESVAGVATGSSSLPQGGLVNVHGWAVDNEDGSPVAKVRILLDGTSIGDAIMGGSRPDVANYFSRPDYANSGWTFTGSVGEASVGTHTVSVAAYDRSGNLTTSSTNGSITVTAAGGPVTGYTDVPTISASSSPVTITVPGWAFDSSQSSSTTISRVDVQIDGQYLGSATTGISRPDVQAAYGHSNAGWSFTGSLAGFAPGAHLIESRGYNANGASSLIGQEQQIVIPGTMVPLTSSGQAARYEYALTYQPNGNILTAGDTVNGVWTYTYDSLNRLTQAQGANMGAGWTYDSFGNRTSQYSLAGSAPELASSFSTASNRADQFCYDAAGNMLDQVPCGDVQVHEFAYDAESKLVSSAFGSTTYVYDADGLRVAKQSNGRTTDVYFYDVLGRMTVDTGVNNSVIEELYAGDRHIATRQNGQIVYAHTNWLGTEAARSDQNGNLCETISALPFGDGVQVSGSCNPSNKFFTGFERDAESGLDHATFRQYASTTARWMSPDPYNGSMDLGNPQSFNRYTYAANNPLRFIDPLGLQNGDPVRSPSCSGGCSFAADVLTLGIDALAYKIESMLYHPKFGGTTSLRPNGDGTYSMSVYTTEVSSLPASAYSLNLFVPSNGPQPKPLDWKKVGSCLASSTLDHYGLTGVTGLSGLLAIPISKSLVPPFRMIGSPTTNLFSVLGHYAEITVPRITIDGLASTNLLRIAGRANPYVAAGLLAVDAGMIGYGTYQCYQKP